MNFLLSVILDAFQESPFVPAHLHNACASDRLRNECNAFVGNGRNLRAVIRKLPRQVKLQWHKQHHEQGKASCKGVPHHITAHRQNGHRLDGTPKQMIDEECGHEEAFDIVAGQIHDPTVTGRCVLMRRGQTQRFVVNGGYASNAQSHTFPPCEEKDVMMFHNHHKGTEHQQRCPQEALVVPSLEIGNQLA